MEGSLDRGALGFAAKSSPNLPVHHKGGHHISDGSVNVVLRQCLDLGCHTLHNLPSRPQPLHQNNGYNKGGPPIQTRQLLDLALSFVAVD
jgi:hypothetical protein